MEKKLVIVVIFLTSIFVVLAQQSNVNENRREKQTKEVRENKNRRAVQSNEARTTENPDADRAENATNRDKKNKAADSTREELQDVDLEKAKANAYGKNKGNLSGKEFGQARSEAAKAGKNYNEINERLMQSEEKIKSSEEKIKTARKKAEDARKTGRINEEEYSQRNQKITEIE